jgi:hypothetical protein
VKVTIKPASPKFQPFSLTISVESPKDQDAVVALAEQWSTLASEAADFALHRSDAGYTPVAAVDVRRLFECLRDALRASTTVPFRGR